MRHPKAKCINFSEPKSFLTKPGDSSHLLLALLNKVCAQTTLSNKKVEVNYLQALGLMGSPTEPSTRRDFREYFSTYCSKKRRL